MAYFLSFADWLNFAQTNTGFTGGQTTHFNHTDCFTALKAYLGRKHRSSWDVLGGALNERWLFHE